MKRTMPLLVLTAAILGLGFTGAGRGHDDGWEPGKANAPLGFGQQIAGAYLVVVNLTATPFEAVVQISADGGTAMSNTLLPNGNTLATAFGSWKRTGVRTIAATFLIRIINQDGEHVFYEKVVSEFTVDGKNLAGEAAGLIYLPTQDPTDPEVARAAVLGPGPLVGKRIPVVALTQ